MQILQFTCDIDEDIYNISEDRNVIGNTQLCGKIVATSRNLWTYRDWVKNQERLIMPDEQQNSAPSAEVTNQSLPESTPPVEQPATSAPESKEVEIAKTKSERTFTRDELARASAESKRKGYEEAKAEAERERERERNNQSQGQINPPQAIPAPTAEVVEQKIMEMYARSQQQAAVQQLLGKLGDNAVKHPDWEEVTNDLGDIVNQNTAPLFNQFDNAADIIYELGKNPGKIPQLAGTLVNPVRAYKVLKQMSDAIKANQAASQQPAAKPPLGQEKPPTSGVDSGSMTVSDLRSQSWLRD